MNGMPPNASSLSRPLLLVGVLLIAAGAGLMLYLAMLVFQVLNSPQDVALVQYVLAHIKVGDLAIFGHLTEPESGQKVDFALNWSESVRTMSFLFLGVALLGILAGILKVLLSGGIGLVRLVAELEQKSSGT